MTPEYVAIIIISCAVATCFAGWFVWFSNSALTVKKYSVKSHKSPREGVRLVHLSDLHAKQFGKGNKRLIAAVAAQRPDFIAFTGDAIHVYRQRDVRVAVALVQELVKLAPVYFVSGNHEMRNKNYRSFSRELSRAGAVVLENEGAEACGIALVGLGCANLRNNKLFGISTDAGAFRLLLAHEPQFITRYALAGYDLVLCGHAHGGQWRIPFTNQGLFAPGQGLFPQLTSGEHVCGSTRMIISRGLGNSEFPLRLFNRPEVLVIEISRD